MEKFVLVVDDNLIDRKILAKILSTEYVTIEAANGVEALDILAQRSPCVSGVIFDLCMPVMDGYGFLEAISQEPRYSNIPLIAATGSEGPEHERSVLECGAWDFVSKPYDSVVLRLRLANAIARSQESALERLRYLAEFDALTGLFNKPKFFNATHEMLLRHPDEHYAFMRFDIDRFQLVNLFFGSDEGDRFLCCIADGVRAIFAEIEHSTFGRIESDVFACCLPYSSRKQIERLVERCVVMIKSFNRTFDIVPVFGIYVLDDPTLPVATMLDRATLAAKTCKGKYVDTRAWYVPEMSARIELEQSVLNDMGAALAERQFTVYYQPKFELDRYSIVGAEALVRWQHPVKGLVSPGTFIPVFERNGFIARLDRYVWEEVCRQLREWMDEGVSPWPVSVNVSRVNLHNPYLVAEICELVERYGVPPKLFELELTESAYMDNPRIMKQVVAQLREAGFTVLMDDFGAGYSSLSILKDIDVDILKIDMRFLEGSDEAGRSESIIASVVRMAKWLGIPAIAEGVEHKREVEFLHDVGCECAQGFYFARPMPVDEYVDMARRSDEEHAPMPMGGESSWLWRGDPRFERLFEPDARPACVFELTHGKGDIVRANRRFCDLLGYGNVDRLSDFLACLDEEGREKFSDVLRSAAGLLCEGSCECSMVTRESSEPELVTLRFARIEKLGPFATVLCRVYERDESSDLPAGAVLNNESHAV